MSRCGHGDLDHVEHHNEDHDHYNHLEVYHYWRILDHDDEDDWNGHDYLLQHDNYLRSVGQPVQRISALCEPLLLL